MPSSPQEPRRRPRSHATAGDERLLLCAKIREKRLRIQEQYVFPLLETLRRDERLLLVGAAWDERLLRLGRSTERCKGSVGDMNARRIHRLHAFKT